MSLQDSYQCWTDDLPVCKQTGVGFSTNQIYHDHGHRQEEHPFEDCSFHCHFDDSTFLYGIFDGHEGSKTANFAMQKTAAELLLGQLKGKTSTEEVKEVLRQAFVSVEQGYIDYVGGLVAERTTLKFDIPAGLNEYEQCRKFPVQVNRLSTLNSELSSGTSAVVALIHDNKLYVANVGDSRALLCKTDENQVLRVVQLTVDHDLRNKDELLRLSKLGLNVDTMRQGSRLGNQDNTRCLGNYLIKQSYKEFEELASASSEPIIAEPEIHGGVQLDDSCRFLLLMSRGLPKALEEATETDQVNKELASMAVEQFKEQSTLTGVAQAIVDKVARMHHDMHMSNGPTSTGKRDDITLLVRNLNYPLQQQQRRKSQVQFDPVVQSVECMNLSKDSCKDENLNSNNTLTSTNSSTTSSNSDAQVPLDRNARIKPYVDFSGYYKKVEKRKQEGSLPHFIDFD